MDPSCVACISNHALIWTPLIKRRRKYYARNFSLYSGFEVIVVVRVWTLLLCQEIRNSRREFAIGMGPKIFAHIGRMDGLYHSDLASWGYVRMASCRGDDTAEIKGRNSCQRRLLMMVRLNASIFQVKKLDQTALPMQVAEDKLFIRVWFWKKKKHLQWLMQRL